MFDRSDACHQLEAAVAKGQLEGRTPHQGARTTAGATPRAEDRRGAVADLRALGDKRAIPALKKARYRMRGGVLGFGNSNTNSCLKNEAEEAVSYLERRP